MWKAGAFSLTGTMQQRLQKGGLGRGGESRGGEGKAGQRRAGRGRAGGRTLELVIFYFMPFCAFGILNKFPSIW